MRCALSNYFVTTVKKSNLPLTVNEGLIWDFCLLNQQESAMAKNSYQIKLGIKLFIPGVSNPASGGQPSCSLAPSNPLDLDYWWFTWV